MLLLEENNYSLPHLCSFSGVWQGVGWYYFTAKKNKKQKIKLFKALVIFWGSIFQRRKGVLSIEWGPKPNKKSKSPFSPPKFGWIDNFPAMLNIFFTWGCPVFAEMLLLHCCWVGEKFCQKDFLCLF